MWSLRSSRAGERCERDSRCVRSAWPSREVWLVRPRIWLVPSLDTLNPASKPSQDLTRNTGVFSRTDFVPITKLTVTARVSVGPASMLRSSAEDFVKSMKPGWLGGHGGTPALLHVRERSGIMACRGAAGEGVASA